MLIGKFSLACSWRVIVSLPALAQQAPVAPPRSRRRPLQCGAGGHAPAAEDSSIKTTEVAARTVIQTHGAASWEEGYGKINESLAKLHAARKRPV